MSKEMKTLLRILRGATVKIRYGKHGAPVTVCVGEIEANHVFISFLDQSSRRIPIDIIKEVNAAGD